MFYVTHMDGSGDANPPLERLPDLYDELLSADGEHGDVRLSTRSRNGVCRLTVMADSYSNISETGGERHMIPVRKARVFELWGRLIYGDIDGLLLGRGGRATLSERDQKRS